MEKTVFISTVAGIQIPGSNNSSPPGVALLLFLGSELARQSFQAGMVEGLA